MSTSETGMDSPAPQDTAQAFERATSSNVVIKNMPHSAKMASRNKFAMNLSWAVNILLFIAKVVAFALSRSFSVLASAADSFVDLSSQAVLALAIWRMHKEDLKYPIGRTRLETVAVIICAVIMSIATVEVIHEAIQALVDGLAHGNKPNLDASALTYAILGVAVGLKVGLYLVCVTLRRESDTMMALAEDHLNDIFSNLVAIFGAALASNVRKVWWIDPAGALAISLYIIYSWVQITRGQVDKILGKTAPSEFIGEVRSLALAHSDILQVDAVRAYHIGSKFMVELEIILPEGMTVKESHDLALLLQHKVEALAEVERAFVHVDYIRREELEHKVERNLASGAKDLFMPHQLVAERVPLRAAQRADDLILASRQSQSSPTSV